MTTEQLDLVNELRETVRHLNEIIKKFNVYEGGLIGISIGQVDEHSMANDGKDIGSIKYINFVVSEIIDC